MKNIVNIVVLCIASFLSSATLAQRHCAVDELLDNINKENPDAVTSFHEISDEASSQYRNEIVIPVVVHVVYKEEKNNISEFQILSQIEALNAGFQDQTTDIDNILPAHRELMATTNIRFVLACTAPDGAFTNGITRTKTDIPNIGFFRSTSGQYAVHHTDQGGRDPWPTSDYVNVWVAEMEIDFLGRSSVPVPLPDPFQDGVVIGTRNFGFAGLAVDRHPYHLGRTLVHEMGHFMGLAHPWGQGTGSCLVDDDVSDTPLQSEIYYDCPSETSTTSCGSPDMALNIMGYADDACLLYFTIGQVNRMMNTLTNYRASLLYSTAADNCGLVANNNDEISFWNHITNREWIARFPTQQQRIASNIYNMKGQLVQSFTFENTDLVHLNVGNFSNGMYIVEFSFDDRTEVFKVAIY